MGGTGLAMAQSTRPLLPVSPRFEQARAGAWPYDLSRTLHTTGWRHLRLFLVYSSFIGFFIYFLCIIVTLGEYIVGPAGTREEDTGADAGEDGEGGGRAAEDGGDSSVHAKSWRRYGCSSATFAIRSTSTSTSSLFYSYEYKCFSLYVHAYGQT